MNACPAFLCTFLAAASLLSAEIIEEETWYNAEGQVIKTVKRTLTGADARREADWEPAWVLRERDRDSRVGGRSYYAPRRYYGSSGYYYAGYSPRRYSYGLRYCGYRSYYGRRSYGGVRAVYSNGRFAASYRAPGFSLYYRR